MFVFSHSQIFIVRKLFHIKISLTQNFSENNGIYLRAKVLYLKHLRHLTFALFLLANPHHVVAQSAFWDNDIFILHYNRQYLIGYNRAGRRALLDMNQNTCIQRRLLYIIFLKGRQRKNIGRLLRNFYNFKLASKCEVPAKNGIRYLFEQLGELVCPVSGAKVKSFFSSFQAGPSVSCQPSKLDCINEICGGNSVQPIAAYETIGGFLTVRYFQWMRSFQ